MEGYIVMAAELRAHFAEFCSWPSHFYLQVGVGGLATTPSCAAGLAALIAEGMPPRAPLNITEGSVEEF